MTRTITLAAARVRRDLRAHAEPVGDFDPSRYFRSIGPFSFLNVRTAVVRHLGRTIAREHRSVWSLDDAVAFADLLLRETYLEMKGAGIETLACFRRQFEPRLLGVVRGWLAEDRAANWATTDTICGSLVAPLLLAYPDLVPQVVAWATHRNLWVRRASAVSLVKLAARGLALDAAYTVAETLQTDPHDLIHKAAGWLLREAGRTDPQRLTRYLLSHGPAIPRTTVRYAIEKFDVAERKRLLEQTRVAPASRPRGMPSGSRTAR